MLRANILETQNEDFVRTARAKGLTERRVLLRHTLRTSMITFVSLFGLDFGALVAGGALLIEVVFGIHGVGYLTYQALANLDLPTIMATVVYGAFFIVLANAVVDIALRLARPEDPADLMSRANRCSTCATSRSPSAPRTAWSRPSTGCRSPSPRARRSASWASQVPARASR